MKINITNTPGGFRVELVVNDLGLFEGTGHTVASAWSNALFPSVPVWVEVNDEVLWTLDPDPSALEVAFATSPEIGDDFVEPVEIIPGWNPGPHDREARSRSHSRRLNALRRNVYRSA